MLCVRAFRYEIFQGSLGCGCDVTVDNVALCLFMFYAARDSRLVHKFRVGNAMTKWTKFQTNSSIVGEFSMKNESDMRVEVLNSLFSQL